MERTELIKKIADTLTYAGYTHTDSWNKQLQNAELVVQMLEQFEVVKKESESAENRQS